MISEVQDVVDLMVSSPPASGVRRKVIVGSSVPNPNGDMHLGHLAGPFLSADLYARYRRMCGDEVYYQSGTDDYQTWTATMASREGSTPAATAAKYADMIEASLRAARVEPAHLQRPSISQASTEVAQDMIRKLYEDGWLVIREVSVPYCEPCDRLLFEGYLEGRCPHCDTWTYGSGCEACARPLDGTNLGDPRCKLCSTPSASRRPLRRLYFPLRPHKERLERYYSTLHTNAYQRAVWQRLLDDGLPDLAASQPTDWGVPIPLPELEGHCVAPYLQMVADHLAASRTLAEKVGAPGGWQTFWHGEDVAPVQFSGPDNGWVFGVFYIAVFLAYDPEFRPPIAYYPTQFYRLEDSIFSTSRRHAIWVREIVEKTSADVVRFYCAHTSPEVEQTTFRLRELVEVVTHELGGWEEWLRELFAKVERDFGGIAPAAELWTSEQRRFHERLERLLEDAARAYETETFSPQDVTRVAMELARVARRFCQGEKLRSTSPALAGERRTGVALELAAARMLSLLCAPLMPDFSARLWAALGYQNAPEERRWETVPGFLRAGQRLAPPVVPLFPDVRHLVG